MLRAEVRFLLRVVAIAWLTLFRRSSAGRNLITLFRHVNNPAHFFSGGAPGRFRTDRRDERQSCAPRSGAAHERLQPRARKAHKKKAFHAHRLCANGNASAARCDRSEAHERAITTSSRPSNRPTIGNPIGRRTSRVAPNCANFYGGREPTSRSAKCVLRTCPHVRRWCDRSVCGHATQSEWMRAHRPEAHDAAPGNLLATSLLSRKRIPKTTIPARLPGRHRVFACGPADGIQCSSSSSSSA